MKPTFVTFEKPLITVMVSCETAEEAKAQIRTAIAQGAEALGVQLEWLRKEDRDENTLRDIFAACDGRPVYVTSYRGQHSSDCTDEQRVELLLRAMRCGGTLADVMGDLYAPSAYEMTFDETAVAKQKALIEQIHALGGEVLMSAHFRAFLDEDTVVRFARAQEERGADVVKLVNFAEDEAQLITNLTIVKRLKAELSKRFLLLANGAYCHLLRQMGPAFGVCMYLCRLAPEGEQPRVATVRYLRDKMV